MILADSENAHHEIGVLLALTPRVVSDLDASHQFFGNGFGPTHYANVIIKM